METAPKKQKASIVKRMIWAVALGFVVGIICILVRDSLGGKENAVWRIIDALLFQDITATKGVEGLGLFYIIGQLFMRGLQLAIVPLVLTSLSLALCSLADPQKLGKIAGRPLSHISAFMSVPRFWQVQQHTA
jgi:Na+/H+-dicarboxylate symporter